MIHPRDIHNLAYAAIAGVCWMVATAALIGVLAIAPHLAAKAATEIEGMSE